MTQDILEPQNWLVTAFLFTQVLYLLTFLIDAYLFSLPVDWVDVDEAKDLPPEQHPYIVMFYPVLNELCATMHTTLLALSRLDYPKDRYRVVAIPNADDLATVISLRALQAKFDFLQIIEVPPTSDPSWQTVWTHWSANRKAYWWHEGRRAGVRDLPPKKTRQLVYALYATLDQRAGQEDFLVNYIDADSCPPTDHFKAAAAGMRRYDVLQAQNVAGNLNASLAASWHAFDHMAWDGLKYPHLSANGRQPFWVLGKGLFFRASDLLALGGFHPWITIEDPEVGMRFWANGKRLGVIANPLIEEVPLTFARGVTQRKRWVAGFFQSLGSPLGRLGFTPWQRFKAWLNFLPCLSLWINALGLPSGAWALWMYAHHADVIPQWAVGLAAVNIVAFVVSLTFLYASTWRRTALVLDSIPARLGYMLRVNPVCLMVWWVVWLIPLAIGLWMYLRDSGLVWERTEKVDANKALIESKT